MTFAPRTWVVGEVVTAALLNQEVRDQIGSMLAAWTSYTPTWTASTNPVLNNGTATGAYMKIGRTCHCQFQITAGSTTTFGSGGYMVGVPFTSAASGLVSMGAGRFTGSQTWYGVVTLGSNVAACNVIFPLTTANTTGANAASNAPESWANGHTLRGSLTYQTAS
ncbi:hypothetical protein ACIP9H_40545 [Streptomyces sp. NPDC088732]|uniref:hypothetical protein n=1 Tax=Streptomyces sp. NPDC088732 TaxID=3365879 RepID=UPI00382697F7